MNFLKRLLVGALLLGSLGATAQVLPYPVKPITLVVPYPVTGAVDVLGRELADKLATVLDQQVVVVNRPGGGGTVGAAVVAAAPPDGYTLILGGTGSHVSGPMLYKQLPYDPVKSFEPVGMVSDSPHLVALGTHTRATTMRELLAELKAKGGNARFGSTGAGTMSHMAGEQFKRTFGLQQMVHVPYEGGPKAAAALVNGEVDMAIINFPDAIPLVKVGRMRVLATTGAKRSQVFPALPTVHEAHLGHYQATTWVGVYAPARTPAPVVKVLTEALATALQNKELQFRLRAQGHDPMYLPPQPFADFVHDQTEHLQKMVSDAHISLN